MGVNTGSVGRGATGSPGPQVAVGGRRFGGGILFSVTAAFIAPGGGIDMTIGLVTAGGAGMGIIGGAAMGPTIPAATGRGTSGWSSAGGLGFPESS
jgi:hypothetical protein